jgi:hypothetical protein
MELRYSQGLIRLIFGLMAGDEQLQVAIIEGQEQTNVIRGRNKAKKRVRPVGHRSVEVGFGLCFQ